MECHGCSQNMLNLSWHWGFLLCALYFVIFKFDNYMIIDDISDDLLTANLNTTDFMLLFLFSFCNDLLDPERKHSFADWWLAAKKMWCCFWSFVQSCKDSGILYTWDPPSIHFGAWHESSEANRVGHLYFEPHNFGCGCWIFWLVSSKSCFVFTHLCYQDVRQYIKPDAWLEKKG